ncbi:MAG: dihydrofolate reductase [Verrucomicrobia bacterium]|nr:MAG: dihydrofolate reductase [Verrucomicrobiota bacterium]
MLTNEPSDVAAEAAVRPADGQVPNPDRLHWKAVAAVSLNRVIGRHNQIPWYLPEDFRWFKQLTNGGTLVMGRRTFESIGRVLPGRQTVVLSRAGFSHPSAMVARSLDEVAQMSLPEPVFICGGAEIYRIALPRCAELYLTRVKRIIRDGDAFFPPFEDDFELVETLRDEEQFAILHYRNRRLGTGAPPTA